MKKITALILCALMILSVFALASCGGGGEKESGGAQTEGTGTGENGEINLTDEIPDGKYDFKEKEFIVTAPWPDYWGVNKYDVTELTGDTVDDEVYYRNRKIEARFNAKISAYECGTTDKIVEDLSPHILADDGSFNVIAFAYSTASYGLISAGLLCPWNDVPVINYKKPWWNDSAINCGTLNGTNYFNAGAFNWYSIGFTTVFFFNETVRQQYGIEDLYALVDNGEWTLDKVTELSRLVAKDDGNGKWNFKDTYGTVGSANDMLAMGCGFTTVDNHGDGTYTINLGNAKHQAILEKLMTLLKKENHIAYNQAGDIPIRMFQEDRALFLIDWIYDIDQFRMMESDFGILPYPKFDTEQDRYYNFSQAWGLANALPINTRPEDYEFFGVMMEALACESYNTVLPAFYDYTLKGRDTRDTDSWRMLDLINNTLLYDFGYFFMVGNSVTAISMPFQHLLQFGKESSDLSSYVAQHIDEITSQYDEIMEFGKN